jgi:hypothetical protein
LLQTVNILYTEVKAQLYYNINLLLKLYLNAVKLLLTPFREILYALFFIMTVSGSCKLCDENITVQEL